MTSTIKDKTDNKYQNGTMKNHTIIRPSLLTQLTQLPHLWCMYNFSVAIFILVWMRASYFEFAHKGRINLGWRLIFLGFGQLDAVLMVWSCLQLMVFLVHPVLRIWATGEDRLRSFNAVCLATWRTCCISLYIVFQLTFLAAGVYFQTSHSLPIASSFIILLETIRFMMKVHSFVRTVSPRVAGGSPLPPFSCYLYFLFAPTLIYRDSYPRSKEVRWNVVVSHLVEVVLCILFIACLCEIFSVNYFAEIGKQGGAMSVPQLVHYLFDTSLAASLSFVYSFYLFLHAWQNMFAEMMCFADRRFYKDWWAQDNYKTLYANLNTLLQDWLHTYIYTDLVTLTGRRIASGVAFFLPVILYQAVFSLTLGSFLPAIVVLYTAMAGLGTFIDEVRGNLFVWTTLMIGNGLLWMLSSMEYYARTNCSYTTDDATLPLTDFLLPRLWTCDNIIITRK